VPSITTETISWQDERAELGTVLHSPLFARSPALSRLLSYLCEKTFAGETDQIKEYSVAVDVFDRGDSFDQDSDSIVRVEANRLRKRLSEYYARDGAAHVLHISIPVGQYVPQFQRVLPPGQSIERKAVRGLIPQRQFESLQSATSGLWEQQSWWQQP